MRKNLQENFRTRGIEIAKILSADAQIGLRHGRQLRLRLLREAREHHRDVVAGMFVAGAGHNDARAMERAAVAWRL